MAEETFSLRLLVDRIPELAWTALPDGFIDFYNDRFYEYTGTKPEEIEESGWESVHHPELVAQLTERWRTSLRSGRAFEMELLLRGANGTYRWFLTRAEPIVDERGKVVRWFGSITDIDESRRLRDALGRAELNEARARREAEAAVQTVTQLYYAAIRRVDARD